MSDEPQRSSMALLALLLGLGSLIFGFITAVPGIITGHYARKFIREHSDTYTGSGMALIGLVLSYTILIITIITAYILYKHPEYYQTILESLKQGSI